MRFSNAARRDCERKGGRQTTARKDQKGHRRKVICIVGFSSRLRNVLYGAVSCDFSTNALRTIRGKRQVYSAGAQSARKSSEMGFLNSKFISLCEREFAKILISHARDTGAFEKLHNIRANIFRKDAFV